MRAVLEVCDVALFKGAQLILEVPYLKVEEGKVLGVMGPNGAGKTTLLQVMAALEKPTRGTVLFHGRDISKMDKVQLRRRMAVVFQEPLLLSGSVLENVTLGLKIRGVPGKERKERAEFWLQKLKISHLVSRSTRFLSGGEAQRVALARALVLEPEVLFLDEPFAFLDQPSRRELIEDLAVLLHAPRLTAVLVTHREEEALALADQVCFLEQGRIVRTIEPKSGSECFVGCGIM